MTRLAYTLTLVTLLLGVAALQGLARSTPVPLRQPLQGFPLRLAGWQGTNEFFEPGILASLGVDDHIIRRYRGGEGPPIWLYVGYYVSQRLSDRVHSPQVCLPGAGWFIVENSPHPVRAGDRTVFVNKAVVQKGDARQLVLYWYDIQGRIIAREAEATRVLAWNALSRRRSDESLVRLNSPISGSVEETLSRQTAFLQAMLPVLDRYLPR